MKNLADGWFLKKTYYDIVDGWQKVSTTSASFIEARNRWDKYIDNRDNSYLLMYDNSFDVTPDKFRDYLDSLKEQELINLITLLDKHNMKEEQDFILSYLNGRVKKEYIPLYDFVTESGSKYTIFKRQNSEFNYISGGNLTGIKEIKPIRIGSVGKTWECQFTSHDMNADYANKKLKTSILKNIKTYDHRVSLNAVGLQKKKPGKTKKCR